MLTYSKQFIHIIPLIYQDVRLNVTFHSAQDASLIRISWEISFEIIKQNPPWEMLKKFTAFFETRRSITVFTRARHILRQLNPFRILPLLFL
jgi:hypothetical protein